MMELTDGHTRGILSVSWCKQDTSLLLSCGKDDRTLLWDLFSGKVIHEVTDGSKPTAAAAPVTAQGMFGGMMSQAAASGAREVQFSPKLPAVVATCSFDRKLQIHNVAGVGGGARAPKWLGRKCGASFGFGGKLVTFGNYAPALSAANPAAAAQAAQVTRSVKVSGVVTAQALLDRCDAFEAALNGGDFAGLCVAKAESSATAHEKDIWMFMKILFQDDARQQLLGYLGYDAAKGEAPAPPAGGEAKVDGAAAAAAAVAGGRGWTVRAGRRRP